MVRAYSYDVTFEALVTHFNPLRAAMVQQQKTESIFFVYLTLLILFLEE